MPCPARESFSPAPLLIAGIVASVALLAAGCQQTEVDPTQAGLDAVQARLDSLENQIAASRRTLDQLETADTNRTEYLDSRLAALDERLAALPESLDLSCPEPATAAAACEEVARVEVRDDKLLVGELEYAWIDPPGITVVARMDSGATSSSVHADNLMTFERDGEDWVRFDMPTSDGEPVTVERQVIRYARVIQQADPEGSRRPVIEMRVLLGDVEDTFEFTLADRSHLENDFILGRNFLSDVTLVDVGRQFIQPRHSP